MGDFYPSSVIDRSLLPMDSWHQVMHDNIIGWFLSVDCDGPLVANGNFETCGWSNSLLFYLVKCWHLTSCLYHVMLFMGCSINIFTNCLYRAPDAHRKSIEKNLMDMEMDGEFYNILDFSFRLLFLSFCFVLFCFVFFRAVPQRGVHEAW